MRLVADENVPRPVVERLRSDGHTLIEISQFRPGMADSEVMACSQNEAILLTHDRDFGELAIARALPVVGVILLETERLSLPAQIERLSACLSDATMKWVGMFSVIEPARIRQRSLGVQA